MKLFSNCILEIPCTFFVVAGLFMFPHPDGARNAACNSAPVHMLAGSSPKPPYAIGSTVESNYILVAGRWSVHCVHNMESISPEIRWLFFSFLCCHSLATAATRVRFYHGQNFQALEPLLPSYWHVNLCAFWCVWCGASFRHCRRSLEKFLSRAEVTISATISASDRYFMFRQSTNMYNI